MEDAKLEEWIEVETDPDAVPSYVCLCSAAFPSQPALDVHAASNSCLATSLHHPGLERLPRAACAGLLLTATGWPLSTFVIRTDPTAPSTTLAALRRVPILPGPLLAHPVPAGGVLHHNGVPLYDPKADVKRVLGLQALEFLLGFPAGDPVTLPARLIAHGCVSGPLTASVRSQCPAPAFAAAMRQLVGLQPASFTGIHHLVSRNTRHSLADALACYLPVS